MAITSSFANLATVSRASKKTDAGGWDFTSGGTVGTLTEYASGVAAIHSTAGLLVEEGSTNEIRNPRFEGGTLGVFGSGGVPPTNLSYSMPGCSLELTATGTENGWNFAEFRISGTPTASPYFHLENGVSAVPALTGETHTTSIGVRVSGGTLANISGVQINNVETTAGAGIVAGNAGSVEPLDTFHRRFFLTTTLSGGGTVANLRPRLQFMWTSGAIDITVRLFAPQCENKAYPTSPILPEASSPAAATRARDQISIPLPAEFFSNAGGTIYMDMTAGPWRADAVRQVPWALYLSSSRRLYPYFIDNWKLFAWDGSDIIPSTSGYTLSTGLSSHRIAVYLSDSNMKWAINGAGGSTEDYSITPSATLGISSYNKLIIGSSNNTRCLNGYIKDLRYWPRELSDSEMASLVGI